MARQLVQPNRSVVGIVGLCLQYVRQVYGRPAIEPTALVGWQRAQYKHADANHPRDVAVPLWWNFTDSSDDINYGHVVWFDPSDGTYNSSPFDTNTGWYIGRSIDDITTQLRRFGAASYLGWTEDISGVRVVEVANNHGGFMIIQDAENWYGRCNDTHWRIRGRELSRSVFKSFVGTDFLHFVESCSDDPEARRVQEWQNVGKLAVNDKWQKQIYDLQDGLKKSNAALNAAQQDSAIKGELEKTLKICQEDNAKLIEKTDNLNTKVNQLDSENLEAEKLGQRVLRVIAELFTSLKGGKS